MDVTTHPFQNSPLSARAFTTTKGASSRLGRPVRAPGSFNSFGVVEIFKKTPCAADLKPAGRDVAKDMLELDSMNGRDTIELKITGERPVAGQTKWQLCATSHMPKVIWEFACQDGAADFGSFAPGFRETM
jgi:hypothetical protein